MEAINVPELEIGIAGRAAELVTAVDGFKIVDDKTLGNASDFIRQIKAAWDMAEDERNSYVRPLNTAVKDYNAQFKIVQNPLKDAETFLKGLIKTYQRVQAAEQAKLEAEQRAMQVKAETDAATNNKPPPVAPPPLPKTGPIRGEFGSKAVIKEHWIYQLEDLSRVPLKYLMVDDKAVKLAIKDGTREIPGLKIYDDGTVAIS